MPSVRVGDIDVYYTETGVGEPLLLIMGFGGDHTAWAFQQGAFARRCRVIALDNRGAGQTSAPDQPYATPMMAADTRGLMDALGIDRAHVVGVSRRSAPWPSGSSRRRRTRSGRIWSRCSCRTRSRIPTRSRVTGFVRQGEAIAAHDAIDRLEAIRCPTLVSVAADDILVPPRFSRDIGKRIPGAELRVVPGVGHCYFLDRPDLFNEISLDFIERSSR